MHARGGGRAGTHAWPRSCKAFAPSWLPVMLMGVDDGKRPMMSVRYATRPLHTRYCMRVVGVRTRVEFTVHSGDTNTAVKGWGGPVSGQRARFPSHPRSPSPHSRSPKFTRAALPSRLCPRRARSRPS
eukprot:594105-Prymnesium_polylepis.1